MCCSIIKFSWGPALEYRLDGVIPDVVFTLQPHFSCSYLPLICLLTNQNIQLLFRIKWTTGNGILMSSSHWPIYNKLYPGFYIYIAHYLSSIFIHIHCHARVYLLTINRSVPPAPQCPLPPVSGLVTGWKPEDECLLVSDDAMDTAARLLWHPRTLQTLSSHGDLATSAPVPGPHCCK